ncbi:MAG: RNA-binding protein [Bacteroidia bacterium]|nr:RNA-binding protein [Bacteroidia bacterium]
MNIYIGNLNWTATDDELRSLFSQFGEVTSINIVNDKFTGRSKGFGFVEMPDNASAQSAINSLNGQSFKDRNITVNEARPREERPNRERRSYNDRGSDNNRRSY